MTDTDQLIVTPSIALLAPSTRLAFARLYRAAASCFEEARCPERMRECEHEAELLEGNDP